jgi:hypothetical protein
VEVITSSNIQTAGPLPSPSIPAKPLALACCEPSCATWSYLSTNWRTCFKWRVPRQFSVISSQLSILCAAIKLGCPRSGFSDQGNWTHRDSCHPPSKKQSESVSFPPRSPKARDLHPTDEDLSVGTPDRGHPDCGGDCTWRPWPPAADERAICHLWLVHWYSTRPYFHS